MTQDLLRAHGVCPVCRLNINNEEYCENCGFIQPILFSNNDDIPNTKCSSLRLNIIETLEKFKGNTYVPSQIIEIIKEEINKRGIEKITRQNIFTILKELRLNKYYQETNSIYAQLTGEPSKIIDRSVWEKLLGEFLTKYEYGVYARKNSARKNSLNVQFVLMKGLQYCNYDCSMDEINTLKTYKKYLEHEKIFEEICEIVGWDYSCFSKKDFD